MRAATLETSPLYRIDEVRIIEWLHVLRRQRWVIAAVLGSAVAAAALWNATAPRVYEASVTLLAGESQRDNMPVVRPPTAVLFQNREIATDVIARLAREGPPYRLTPEELVRHVSLEETSSGVFQLKVRLTDAHIAAAAANHIADGGLALQAAIGESDEDSGRKSLARQLTEARAALTEADQAILTYIAEHKERLTPDSMHIAITRRPLISSPDDPRVRRFTVPGTSVDPLRPGAQAGAALLTYDGESGLRQLVLARDAIERAYVEVAAQYASSRIHVSARRSSLQVIDRATVPERPIAPRTFWNFAVTAVAGLLIAVTAAFVVDFLRVAARAKRLAGESTV